MTKQEYDNKLENLIKDFEDKKRKLNKEYAFDNNPHEIGDIVQDHGNRIIIEEIKWTHSMGNDYPSCVYVGQTFTLKNLPTKKIHKERVYQERIIYYLPKSKL